MDEVIFAGSMIKAALAGVGSAAPQFGPREPMNEVFPKSTLFSTVKFTAEVIAIPYPNAPVKKLFKTVPEELAFALSKSPIHVWGPIAMPILRCLPVSEVFTLSQGKNRLDYDIIHINAVILVGRV